MLPQRMISPLIPHHLLLPMLLILLRGSRRRLVDFLRKFVRSPSINNGSPFIKIVCRPAFMWMSNVAIGQLRLSQEKSMPLAKKKNGERC